jgi:DinB superfamily
LVGHQQQSRRQKHFRTSRAACEHLPVVVERWQFELTWSLLELHLERLTPADMLWEPASQVWTVRQGADGAWRPDWDEAEPDPIPVPTVGWVMWHIGWWWSVTLDHARGLPPRDRTEVTWPGPDQAVEWLRGLRSEWLAVLGTLDVAAPAPWPWPDDPSKTIGHMVSWVNAELMKNTAELGQLRLLRAAR